MKEPLDPDISGILKRFKARFGEGAPGWHNPDKSDWTQVRVNRIKRFIIYECLALKEKWEREHFDNQ